MSNERDEANRVLTAAGFTREPLTEAGYFFTRTAKDGIRYIVAGNVEGDWSADVYSDRESHDLGDYSGGFVVGSAYNPMRLVQFLGNAGLI